MALSGTRISELKAEAQEALAGLGTPNAVLIYDFSVGASTSNWNASVRAEVLRELSKHSIDGAKLAGIVNRPADMVYRAIAGKAEGQSLSIASYVEEFATQYREIGLPVFTS